jgi:dTDP-4-amino-4,6-dideoxygalactose transaminase
MLISKEATGERNADYSVYFTKSCRDAMRQVLMMSGESNRILIPAYIGLSLEEGSGILDPIKESGTSFAFYAVDFNLDPILESLESRIESFKPTHVLVVNYFGYLISNRTSVFEMLSQFSVHTIEDFAHLLLPLTDKSEVAKLAEYEVYSLHKTIGSNTGGGALLKSRDKLFISNTITNNSLALYAKTNIEYISRIRRRNFLYLSTELQTFAATKFKPFFSDGRGPILPLNFPIRVSTTQSRHELYSLLVESKIFPTALYHRLVPEITDSEYPTSLKVSETILNLPIHQDIELNQLDVMIELLRGYCIGE